MELSVGTPIYGKTGIKVGELNRIVMDGKTGEVTHLVVGKGWLLPRDIVISRDDVQTADPDQIQLRLTEAELEQKPDFYEVHYVSPGAEDDVPALSAAETYLYTPITPPLGMGWTMPYAYPLPAEEAEFDVNVPDGSVTLSDGMDVWSGSDKVGTINGVRIHPRSQQISHIVVSHGWLFPEERIIPIATVKSVDQDGVHLAPSADELRQLPREATI